MEILSLDGDHPPQDAPVASDVAFRTDVVNCARCLMVHQDLPFYALANNPEHTTHWAMCPDSGQPILAKLVRE